jgi:hypothetical protein
MFSFLLAIYITGIIYIIYHLYSNKNIVKNGFEDTSKSVSTYILWFIAFVIVISFWPIFYIKILIHGK